MRRDAGAARLREVAPDGTPRGLTVEVSLDHEEIRIGRTRDPTLLIVALVLAGLSVAAVIYGVMPDGSEMLTVFLAIGTVAMMAVGGAVWQGLSQAPPQIVRLTLGGIDVDGRRVPWEDLGRVHRTAGPRGSGLLLDTRAGVALEIGGHLRPSAADHVQDRIEHFRERTRTGREDPEAAAALEALRGRDVR